MIGHRGKELREGLEDDQMADENICIWNVTKFNKACSVME